MHNVRVHVQKVALMRFLYCIFQIIEDAEASERSDAKT